MKIKQIKFSTLFISFLLSYSFYAVYLLGQINLNIGGKNVAWLYILVVFMLPIIFLLIFKNAESLRNKTLIGFINDSKFEKSYTLITVLITIYLLISGIFSGFYTIYFESMYFYNKYNVIIIAILLFLPILLFSKSMIKSTFHLHPLNIIVYLIFFYLFFTNQHDLKYYTLIPDFSYKLPMINIIFIFIPIFLEPFILFYLIDFSIDKINKKSMFLYLSFFILTSVFSFLFICNQFGVLLEYLEFPFLQGWKNIYINEYIENVDCINILLFILNCILRLMLSSSIVIKLTNINRPIIPVVYGLITLSIACLFTTNTELFEQLKMPLLTINSFILIVISLITFFYILNLGGNKKNATSTKKITRK